MMCCGMRICQCIGRHRRLGFERDLLRRFRDERSTMKSERMKTSVTHLKQQSPAQSHRPAMFSRLDTWSRLLKRREQHQAEWDVALTRNVTKMQCGDSDEVVPLLVSSTF